MMAKCLEEKVQGKKSMRERSENGSILLVVLVKVLF